VKDLVLATNGLPEEVQEISTALTAAGISTHRYGKASEYVDEGGEVKSNYEGKGSFTSMQVGDVCY
jgi:hypothetical protein